MSGPNTVDSIKAIASELGKINYSLDGLGVLGEITERLRGVDDGVSALHDINGSLQSIDARMSELVENTDSIAHTLKNISDALGQIADRMVPCEPSESSCDSDTPVKKRRVERK